MTQDFDQLSPDLQSAVTAITCQLNNTYFPPHQDVMLVPILKPFNWNDVQDETTAGQVPRYVARFERARKVSRHMGRYMFISLTDA